MVNSCHSTTGYETRLKMSHIADNFHGPVQEPTGEGAGPTKKTAGKKARFPEHQLAKSLVSDKESANKPFESVGSQHCR